jgi:hypothetical protein
MRLVEGRSQQGKRNMYRESARSAQYVVAHDDENSQKILADKLSAST